MKQVQCLDPQLILPSLLTAAPVIPVVSFAFSLTFFSCFLTSLLQPAETKTLIFFIVLTVGTEGNTESQKVAPCRIMDVSWLHL